MDANKKISFGFTKLAKKPAVVRSQPVEEKKVELVECLEGQSIKIKDAVDVVEEPLVIPIRDNKKNLLDRVREAKIKRELKAEIKDEDDRPDSELTIEEQAARALIREAKQRLENHTVSNSKVTVLPLKEEKPEIDGEEEPTLEDYEHVPISDYGMAMLRGMGWKEGMGIGKDPSKTAALNIPELRPKGLGLGATRIVKPEQPACDKDGNALILKCGAFAKIIAGSHKGNYCEVQGLDDESGRVIVKTSLKGEILTLNEFLLVPVTQQEFSQGAKVLNNAKYEEYKEIADRKIEAQRNAKSRSRERDSDDDSNGELSSKNEYHRKERDVSSHRKTEQSLESDDYGNKSNSETETDRKRREREHRKNKTQTDRRDKRNDDEERRSRHREKQASTSDSDDRDRKSRDKHRDSSDDSDSRSRKHKNKDKKKKKDRHRDRSSSYEERRKGGKKKSGRRSRDRSSDYDYKSRESSRKDKSKSRHRRRSGSGSSLDKNYRKNRR